MDGGAENDKPTLKMVMLPLCSFLFACFVIPGETAGMTFQHHNLLKEYQID